MHWLFELARVVVDVVDPDETPCDGHRNAGQSIQVLQRGRASIRSQTSMEVGRRGPRNGSSLRNSLESAMHPRPAYAASVML